MALGQNSFICKRPFFAKHKFTFANLSRTHVFIPRGYGCSLCCCWDVFKLHVNSNCRQWRVGARSCYDNPTRKPRSFIVSRLPWRHQGAVWAMGFHGHLLFRHCFRRTFAELSRKIICKSTTKSTPWIVLACAASFDYKYIALGSILFILQFNSEGSDFTPRKTRECMINRLIKINFR